MYVGHTFVTACIGNLHCTYTFWC